MTPVRGVVVVEIVSRVEERSLGWPGVSVRVIMEDDELSSSSLSGIEVVVVVLVVFVLLEPLGDERSILEVEGTMEDCVDETEPVCN